MSNVIALPIGHGNDTFPPSKGIYLPGGGKFEEHTFNSNLGLAIVKLGEHNGFKFYLPQKPHSKEVPLYKQIDMINNKDKYLDFLMVFAIHANASSSSKAHGKGIFHWISSKEGKKIAKMWLEEAEKVVDKNNWGSGVWESKPDHWSNFGILRETYAPAVLAEHFFFTNLEELKKYNTKEYIEKFAEAAVRMFCRYAGKKFKPFNEVQNVTKLHRVQTGAFRDKTKALNQEKKLKKDGFDTYIVKEDNLYKVQVGAYADFNNALNIASKLKSKGYSVYLPEQNKEVISKPKPTIKVGSKVKIRDGAKTYKGTSLADYVYNRIYKVTQIKGNRVVVTYNGTVVAAMNKKDLILI